MGTVVRHGHYGWKSVYKITQHKIDHTDHTAPFQAFVEVLEIEDPANRCHYGFIVHIYWLGNQSNYFKFASLFEAVAAYNKIWHAPHRMIEADEIATTIAQQSGFMRTYTTKNIPWFYTGEIEPWHEA